jgi:CIC family chloride channel protein
MLKRLSITGLKFFAAGRGLSVKTGRYFSEAVLVGAFTGFVVVAFRYLIALGSTYLMDGIGHHDRLSLLGEGKFFSPFFTQDSLLDPYRWIMAVLPAFGAVAGYFLIKRFSKLEHARGTDSAIKSYHQNDGYITGTAIPVKSVASVLTVSSGGSAGYEGPVTLIGAACGSMVARYLNFPVRARRILMAAGLAAGIAALFQAPLAGAIFGFEIFYSSSDMEHETVLPCFVASAISYTIYAYFFGWGSLFQMPSSCAYDSGLRLLPYFALALVVTFGARFYISFFRGAEKRFGASKVPGWTKVALGGVLTGIIGFMFPDVLGTSYSFIQSSFTAGQSGMYEDSGMLAIAGLVVFFFMKAIATSCTVGSGGSGGVFAPALVCGGALGAAVGLFFSNVLPPSVGVQPAAFALVGMAGFIASAIRIPLTAIVMVAEISGNHSLLLPAMWVCGISFWLNNGWSLYRSQVHSRDSSPLYLM